MSSGTLSPRAPALHGRGQDGQALVLGMLLAGAVALAFVRYFDAGMIVAEKAKQDHALDAAAYSGALVQARALNMLAYIHRAQMAHQVAMAHLVTLGSLAHFAGTEATRASMANPPAYVIGMHFGPDHAAAYLGALKAAGLELSAAEHASLASAYAQHDRLSRSILAHAAQSVATNLASQRDQAMREVIQANFPGEDAGRMLVTLDTLPGFLAAYSGNRRLRPFLQELTGLYAFLGPRDHTTRSLFPVDARCPSRRHELRRRGQTVLDEGGRWQSIDTQSYHAVRSNRWIGCYFREYAMGWGWVPPRQSGLLDAPHVENPPENFADQDFWRWVRESTRWDISGGNANPLANSWAHSDRREWAGGGLPLFHDLASARGRPVAHFTVSLSRAGRGGLEFTSHSAAESYFRRPHARGDGRRELPNTFHPYWQARLRGSEQAVRQQRGQALTEALVAMLGLIVLWVALHWLAHYQDMALSATHAGRHAAFLATRTAADALEHGYTDPGHDLARQFFSGRAHRWTDRRGQPVLNPATAVKPSWDRRERLSVQAQPGAGLASASVLRRDWAVDDTGILRASIALKFSESSRAGEGGVRDGLLRLSQFDLPYPDLSRSTRILTGAGHAATDDATQARVASSGLAWRTAEAASLASAHEIAGRASGVDSGWSRAAPEFRWLSPWSGRVPAHLIEDYVGD